MKKLKFAISWLLAICIFASSLSAFAAPSAYLPNVRDYSYSFQKRHEFPKDYTEMANALSHLGLFLGTENGFELSRNISRVEALVTIVRLLDREEEARAEKLSTTFSDVPEWAADYAGYGQAHKIMLGYSETEMGAADSVTARQYLTMLLRVLGHDDAAGDFSYDDSVSYAYETGLIDYWSYTYFKADPKLTRNEIVYLMYSALYAVPATAGEPLILQLAFKSDEWTRRVAASLLSKGESRAEIRRALLNGYHEYYLSELSRLAIENRQIPEQFHQTIRECFYAWLKEAGTDRTVSEIKYYISNLKISVKTRESDSVLRENAGIMAYFQYPDIIVIRHNLDPATEMTTLAHELRHAMTSNLSLTFLEEGVTEIWTQEVCGGEYAYPYYYLNLAKVLTHLVGAKAMNITDFVGNYEDLFFEIEKNIGQPFDSAGLYTAMANLNNSTGTGANLAALNERFLALIKDYYAYNIDSIIAESKNSAHFTDTILALGQLLYYPSSMVSRAETSHAALLPSEYYSADFVKWADEMLHLYAAKEGAAYTSLKNYYDANRDTRFSYEYFGPGAGSVFVGGGMAYTVYFQYDSLYSSRTFGELPVAEAFSQLVKVMSIEEKAGHGFAEKIYN